MNRRALVLDLDSSHVTILSEDGEFVRLSAGRLPQARYIGQSVSMSQIKPKSKLGWMPLLAACIFVFLVVIPLVFPPPVMAWVSLDNSSSLEVLVDGKFNIREIRPLNNSASKFLEEYQGSSKDFAFFVDQFIKWSRENGDSSLLVTATDDIQFVTSCIHHFADNVKVVGLEVDTRVRDEAGKKGLSAGRAIFMAEAGSWESISPEKMQEGNPIETLDSAGIDVDSFVDGLDKKNHEAKIKNLPPLNQGEEDKKEGPGPIGKSDTGRKTPPGLAKKDENHPAVRSFSRSGSWGNGNPQKAGKSEEWSEDKRESLKEDKEFKHKDKGNKQKGNANANKAKDQKNDKNKGNNGNNKDKGNNGQGKGKGSWWKSNNGNGKGNKGNNKWRSNNGNKGRKGKP